MLMTAVPPDSDLGAQRTRADIAECSGDTSGHLLSPKCFFYLILITLFCGQRYNKNPIRSSRVTHS